MIEAVTRLTLFQIDAFTTAPFTGNPAAVVRFFAPHYGIPEDPVTGSVHASLPLLLWEAGRLPRTDGVHRIQAEQGDELGRPGRLLLDITVATGAPTAIRVGGQAVTVARGEIFVP